MTLTLERIEAEHSRIVLPKRKVTVQLWRMRDGREVTCIGVKRYDDWTLLGEHTFEIEN